MNKTRNNYLTAIVVAVIAIDIAGGSAVGAENTEWTLQVAPMYMDAFGNDSQVLVVRRIDQDATPATETSTPVALDTEATLANRFTIQYSRASWEDWTVGLDVIFLGTAQGRPTEAAAADGPTGPIDQVVFEVADRSFASNDPDEALSFRVLTDTDIAAWTTDIYGIKTLAETPERQLRLLLGLRNADFDNDYHGVAGVVGVNGSLIDASSNYDMMHGPLVGLIGEVQFGKGTLTGYLGQSVVFGSTNLSRTVSDFVGPAGETQTVVAQESFRRKQDISIPITELRITWLYPISERFSLGLTANASAWSDVPVPPAIEPGATGNGLNKNTIVFFGIGAAVEYRF
jgi:hypothetical protein